MKNFMLFAGDDYYPSGGMNDLVGEFESLDEIPQKLNESNFGLYDWAHIYDVKEDRVHKLSKDLDDRWQV